MNILDMVKLFSTAFFIGSGGNIINDYYDRNVDAINKPWRPIPSGLIKPREALIMSLIFFVIGMLLALSHSIVCSLIAFIAIVLVYLYSYCLKKVFLVGNITIAFLTALAIIYGSAFSQFTIHVALASLYAFLFNLGREFLKGIEDVEGDKMFGIITIASIYGTQVAFYISVTVFILLIMLSIMPIFILGYGVAYAVLALFVDVIVIISLMYARSLRSYDALKATRMLKSAAFAGLFAFLLHSI
jgi:geranylgeranylglycerol-phosphate geranylgeranyltransferase